MSCGCKTKKGDNLLINNENKPKINIVNNIIKYSVKVIGFLVALIFLPILILMIVFQMFNLIVLSKDIDIKPLFISMSKLMKKVAKDNAEEEDDDEEEEDDEEWENVNEEDFVLVGVDDLTNKEDK
tara:strand:- start:1732 stop:2109 length:378 start_codon:yes stop_codon:yes gene_type:complete